MRPTRMAWPLVAVAALGVPVAATTAAPTHELSAEERQWNAPMEPFRIAGNVYYVGASEVTSYLVATPAGHLLIDSGFAATVPQVLANVRTLGFEPRDVKWLLISHPHFDHVGGIADLRDATGARIVVSAADAAQVARGGVGDFAFGDRFPYRPFTADRLVADGDTVELGGSRLVANVTPGHTPGCTTWSTEVVEHGQRLLVAFLCSVTAPGYQLVGNAAYPGIVDDYRASFRRLAAMPVDVFLGAHGSFFGLLEKRRELCRHPERNPFLDPEGWRAHLERQRQAFEKRLREQTGPPSGG